MRARFFGPEASTAPHDAAPARRATRRVPLASTLDIRDADGVDAPLRAHARATSSSSSTPPRSRRTTGRRRDPQTDFTVNANGTLNLLEAARQPQPGRDVRLHARRTRSTATGRTSCRSSSSTTRLELPEDHRYYGGIDTSMSIDRSHALAVRRLEGGRRPAGAGVRPLLRHADGLLPRRLPDRARRTRARKLHGFLSYLMRCTVTGEPYTVFGYDGKQVRDNIHSADVVRAFEAFHARAARRPPSTTSAAGARRNCSMLEAIDAVRADRRPRARLDAVRRGAHRRPPLVDLATSSAFKRDYPDWELEYDLEDDRCARSTTPTSSAGRPSPR